MIEKELEERGHCALLPENASNYRFPMWHNVAVSMIVVDEETRENSAHPAVRQKPSYILVAGYSQTAVRAEEHAVVREVREETGLEVEHLRFNRTKFFEPSNTLMQPFGRL
ncbi:MAG: NUDIX domain-containing protein [Faecalibacterium prausnitzii]